MFAITMYDLRYRFRQFLIAVIGAGLVFSMALLLTGLAESFQIEVQNTVNSVGADRWVVPVGSTGPFTGFGALVETVTDDIAEEDGVNEADPLVIIPQTTEIDGEVQPLRLIGHRLGGMGTPDQDDGRAAESSGEAVADRRLGLDVGEHVDLGGVDLEIVGRTSGLTLLGGIPNVYTGVADAQEIAFQGQPLITTVVTKGSPGGLDGFTVLTSDEVKDDTVHAMKDAVASIENSRTLMWVVAAVIVAALMYVSSLERLRDFAVLKSLGSSSPLLFVGVALQAVVITLLAAGFALIASQIMKPIFPIPVEIPSSSLIVLPIVAVLVGLLSSLVALRRAISVDPTSAFAAAS